MAQNLLTDILQRMIQGQGQGQGQGQTTQNTDIQNPDTQAQPQSQPQPIPPQSDTAAPPPSSFGDRIMDASSNAGQATADALQGFRTKAQSAITSLPELLQRLINKGDQLAQPITGQQKLSEYPGNPETAIAHGAADVAGLLPLFLKAGADSPMAEKFVRYLMSIWPEIKTMNGVPWGGSKMSSFYGDLDKLKQTAPEAALHATDYANAISGWLGSSHQFRDNLQGPVGKYNTEMQNAAVKLAELYEASPNRTTNTLFRASNLGEIPDLKPGATFDNPFLSFSRSSKFVNAKGAAIIALEPGAKSLPIAGLSGFTTELEHVTGGRFKVVDVSILPRSADNPHWDWNRKLVRIKQIDPRIRNIGPDIADADKTAKDAVSSAASVRKLIGPK